MRFTHRLIGLPVLLGLCLAQVSDAQVYRRATGFNLALSPLAAASVDPAVQSWANAVAAAGGAQVAADRLQLLSTMVGSLKTCGAWSRMDWLVVAAAPDQYAARYNIRNSAKSLTAVNSPTFIQDRGWVGDGSTSYLDTGEAANASGNNYSLNSGSVGVWVNSASTSTGIQYLTGVVGGSLIRMTSRSTSGNETFTVNDATGADVFQANTGSRTGFRVISRQGAAVKRGYYGSSTSTTMTRVADLTTAATSVPSANLLFLRSNTTYASDREALMVSGAFTDGDMSCMQSAFYTMLSAIGAN